MTSEPRDDPARDYRTRYRIPDQFVWDRAAWARIDFDGYVDVVLGRLPPPPARILDVGCGPGAVSERLVDAGYQVDGVDYSERAIGFARVFVDGARFQVQDVRRLDDLDPSWSTYDAAVCVEVLEHLPAGDRHDLFDGVYGRLRDGGVFVLTTPFGRMPVNKWDYERPSERELVGMFEEHGFRVVQVGYQHRLHPLFSPGAWRLISNRYYDLRAVRHLLRGVFLRSWNEPRSAARAGRIVITAERVSG